MTGENIRHIIRTVLMSNFNIDTSDFDWDVPLVQLDPNFRILGYLMFLEQLLNDEFRTRIPLLENISASVHTPEDIVRLINVELELQ